MGAFGKALSTFLLGTDEMRRREQEKALAAAALQASGLFQPVPGAIRQQQIAADDGGDITDAFGPQYQQGPSRPRSPQEIAQGLAQLTSQTRGFNPKPYVDLAQYSRPNLMVTPSGEAIDQYDPTNAGRVFPKMGEGIRPTANGGAEMVPNYDRAVAGIEGAKTGAQEQQKAAYDLVDVPMADGSTVKIPRLIANQILSQQFTQGGGVKPGFGQSQTPGDKVSQEGAAKTQVERNAEQPKALSGLQDQARASSLARATIHEILGDVYDAKTGTWAPGGKSMLGAFTTGFGANLAPIKGTPAHDLQARLDTIKAITKVEELQKMRENSPTGGALGNVSNSENEMLSALRGSLDQGQGSPQFEAALRNYLKQLDAIAETRAGLYRNTYGAASSAEKPAVAAPRTTGFRSRILSVGP